ncbi:MAG: BON domain-containing protein [Flavipsychrobacter sp.]
MATNNRNWREDSRSQWNWDDNQSNYGRRSDRDEDYTDRDSPYNSSYDYRTNDRDWNDYNDEGGRGGIQDDYTSQTHRTYNSDYRNNGGGIGYNGDYRHRNSSNADYTGRNLGGSYDRGNDFGRGGQTFRESNYGNAGNERDYGQSYRQGNQGRYNSTLGSEGYAYGSQNSRSGDQGMGDRQGYAQGNTGSMGGYNPGASDWQNSSYRNTYPEDRSWGSGSYRSDMNYMRGSMDQKWDRNMNSGNYYGNPGSQLNTGRYSSSGYDGGAGGTNRYAGSNMGTNQSAGSWGSDTWDQQHRGKGPKGYKRSDERITEEINDRLSDDGSLDASDIEVKVANGEVTLSGTVMDRNSKRRAEDLVEAISGVNNVENRLRVGQSQNTGSSATGSTQGNLANTSSAQSAGKTTQNNDHNGADRTKAKA